MIAQEDNLLIVACMVLPGLLCDISLILDSENQAHHHDQREIQNMRIHF